MSGEFPEEETVGSGREAKGDRDGGLGRNRRRVSGVTGPRNIRGWRERERRRCRCMSRSNIRERRNYLLCNRIQVTTLPRLQQCSCRLVTVQRTKMSGVCTDDGKCVGSPEPRMLRRDLRLPVE